MTESAPRLVVIGFDRPAQAGEFLRDIVRMQRQAQLRLHDAVFIERDAAGRTTVRQTKDATPARGALFGALWGLLIGYLIHGPVTAALCAALAAAVGALLGRLIDTGIKTRKVKALQGEIPPGTAAVALQLSHLSVGELQRELARFADARLVESDLQEPAAAAVRSALGKPGGP